MMYMDANVFIFAAISPTRQGDRARELLTKVFQGTHAITSVLAVDEVMWGLIRNKKPELVRQITEEIYKIRNLKVTGIPASTPLRALDLMEKHKLRPRDALHAAVMEELDIDEIVSDDADFDKIPNVKRVKI